MVLTKRAFLLLEPAEELLVVVDGAAGADCRTVLVVVVAVAGMIGVAALNSASRRSKSATASVGLDDAVVVVAGDTEVAVVEDDDVASAFGLDIIILNYGSKEKLDLAVKTTLRIAAELKVGNKDEHHCGVRSYNRALGFGASQFVLATTDVPYKEGKILSKISLQERYN